MILRPINDYVLIRKEIQKEKNIGKIIVKSIQGNKDCFGYVCAKANIDTIFDVNDKVVYSTADGTAIEINDDDNQIEYVLVHEKNIIAICK